MRAFVGILLAVSASFVVGLAQDIRSRAWQMEKEGDAAGARVLLRNAVQEHGSNTQTIQAYAEFLDRHRDPQARSYYEQLLRLSNNPQDRARLDAATRRLLVLDLVAGDNAAAQKHYDLYKT